MTSATLAAALLTVAAADAGGGCVELVRPAPGEVVVAPFAVSVRTHGGPAVQHLLLELDGVPLAESAAGDLDLVLDPAPSSGAARRLQVRVALADGRVVQADRDLAVARIDQRIDVELALLAVDVHDRDGRPVADLTRDAFRLEVAGRATPILHFERADTSLAIALVFDLSASMLGGRLEASRAAAEALLAAAHPSDRVLVVGFDHRPRLLLPATTDRRALRRTLDDLMTGGGTALHDALAMAIESLATLDGRRLLFVFSDGKDGLSRVGPGRVRRAARRAGVRLFTASSLARPSHPLDRLTRDLGGQRVRLDRAESAARLDAILDTARAGYVLAYTPPEGVGDGARVAIEVARPGLEASPRR